MNVKLIAIAAIGKKRQLGLKGTLPWKILDEYEHFKNSVAGQYVLVGRKNFELHGSEIKGAKAIVLTKNTQYKARNTLVINDINQIFDLAKKENIEKVFVIGGGEIYKITLPYLSEFICSEVEYDGEADTFFPEFDVLDWKLVSVSHHGKWVKKHFSKEPSK